MFDILIGAIEPLISNSNCSIGGTGEADAVHRINLNIGKNHPKKFDISFFTLIMRMMKEVSILKVEISLV